jgi:DNA replication protein DnaC
MRRVREIAARLGEASRDGVCVWLYGSQGAGKTWAACSLLREAILTWGFTGLFFQGTELVRASIDDAARFSSLYGVGWLVLDGIDRVPRTQTGYEKETLSALIKHRVQSRSPTVFTAHCPLKDIPGLVEGQCGAEIVSALRPVTVELALVGGNFSESKGVREKWSQ